MVLPAKSELSFSSVVVFLQQRLYVQTSEYLAVFYKAEMQEASATLGKLLNLSEL